MTLEAANGWSKHVLMVISNPATSTTLGVPVGYWGAELTHPLHIFREAGYEITVASPDGGPCQMDAWSDPRDPSGYSSPDLITMGFIHTPELWALTENTPALASLDPAGFDALVVVGGQGPMFTFRDNPDLQAAIERFWTDGKVVAALCHGVAALMDVRVDDDYLIAGKTMTGFANVEEDAADAYVGQQVMPWRIEDAARERGANYIRAAAFQPFAVREGRLITGQQQHSGARTAELVVAAIGA